MVPQSRASPAEACARRKRPQMPPPQVRTEIPAALWGLAAAGISSSIAAESTRVQARDCHRSVRELSKSCNVGGFGPGDCR